MTQERWERIKTIHAAVLAIEPKQRTAYLEAACGEDAALRHEVNSLLEAGEYTAKFLSNPAMDVAAKAMAEHTADPARSLPSFGPRFETQKEAGRGGMGIVYRAWDSQSHEVVAIKALHPEAESDPRRIERLQREVNLARRVTHPNVCRIHDLHQTGNTAFISMEFIEGESLRRALIRFHSFTVNKGIDLVRQICAGLREAHNKEIVHRDLKPENIMIDQNGVVKVMDFGIARHRSTASTFTAQAGTPSYMSPEQSEGRAVDARSDIYSLGLVMYEILSGHPAFVADSAEALGHKQRTEMPPSPRAFAPGIPEDIAQIVMQCIQKDPARRYPSLDALLSALPDPAHRFASLDPPLATPPAPAAAPIPTPKPVPLIPPLSPEPVYIVEPKFGRGILLAIQFGYLAMYLGALGKSVEMQSILDGKSDQSPVVLLLLLTAVGGIPVRLYLISALGWNHPATGKQFLKLFPIVFALDELWAAAPLLISNMKIGLALACVAALAYLPFAQRTLMANAYRYAPAEPAASVTSAASSR